MAHGAPESLDDISPYLRNIMGRGPSEEIIKQIKERYALVGGKSPLLEITQQQATALENLLNQEGTGPRCAGNDFQVYIGMRHWHPLIDETVKRIAASRPDRLLAISLAPQYSKLSVGAYIETLEKALSASKLTIPVHRVKSWCTQPNLIEAFTEKIKDALSGYDGHARTAVSLLFTAHSLPEEVLAAGDPYSDEVAATVAGIVERLARDAISNPWSFAYQSQGFRRGKWLGPSVEESLGRLGEAACSDLLVAPIGFVCDHVEILYDVDILFRGLAASQGITLKRIESLNTSPRFIEALAGLVHSNLQNFSEP